MKKCGLCLQNVHGEIYRVDEEFLARLDRFEGHPYLYQREVITVGITSDARHEGDTAKTNVTSDKQELLMCSTYLRRNFDQSLLEEETLSSYDSAGSHGRPYLQE